MPEGGGLWLGTCHGSARKAVDVWAHKFLLETNKHATHECCSCRWLLGSASDGAGQELLLAAQQQGCAGVISACSIESDWLHTRVVLALQQGQYLHLFIPYLTCHVTSSANTASAGHCCYVTYSGVPHDASRHGGHCCEPTVKCGAQRCWCGRLY